MRTSGILGTAILFLLFATVSFASPQQEQHEQHGKNEGKPQQGQGQQRPPQQAPKAKTAPPQHQMPTKPAHPQPERPQSPYGAAYHGGVKPNGPTYGGVHHSGVPQQATQVRSGFEQSRAHAWHDEHHTWRERGGYTGYRVPDARFRAYWGRPHPFRIHSLPLLFVGGYPRFRYDGYWVTLVDPWPEAWSQNWYDTDDVYLDYTDDGYYLYNLTHPGPGIAVTITF